jgi:hypothetical protein
MMDEPPRLRRPQFYFVPTVRGGESGGIFLRLERRGGFGSPVFNEWLSDFVHMKMYNYEYSLCAVFEMGIITDVADSDNDEYSTVFLKCTRHHLLYTIYFTENNGNDGEGGEKGGDGREDGGGHGRGDKGKENTQEKEGKAEDPCTPSKC